MIRVYKVMKMVGKVNAELSLSETLQCQNYRTLDETGWESVYDRLKKVFVYTAGSEFMQLAARGCFANKLYRQVQNSVRRLHGQQVECEGRGRQNMAYGFSRKSTFSALLEMHSGLDEPSVSLDGHFLYS